MKIVLIPSAELSYNSGSVIYAKMLFKYLLDSGHQVYMLGSCIPEDIDEKYRKFVKVGKNLLFHPIIDDRYVSDVQYIKMYIDILALITDIYEEWGNVDVIHAHYASINSFASLLIKKILKVPFVISSFGRDINLGFHCDERIKMFMYESMLYADKIIIPDYQLGETIVENIPKLDINRFAIIPMPLDERILYDKGTILIEKQKGVHVISSINSCFTSEKGIEDILEAFLIVSKEYRCELYIAGQDDDENLKNYKRICWKIDDLGIGDKVHLLGYLSREDIGKLFAVSDVFIDARYKGNFSSVLLEAQFKRCITISSNNAAARKIICEGENGVLFPIGDVNVLAEKIESIFCDKEMRDKLKLGMNKWCATSGKEYRKDVCMEKIVGIFQNAIKSYESDYPKGMFMENQRN
jgi:glycosyltransferase involved in cell wall biosynthesis